MTLNSNNLSKSFYKQPLESFQNTDLQKKLNKLSNFNSNNIDKELIDRALRLADGNPRLLEWLDGEVLSQRDADSQIREFEFNSEGWRQRVIWEREDTARLNIDRSIERIVSRCLVFEIPVPLSALEAVCHSIDDSKQLLNKAIALGLIEVNSEREESNRLYRVSRIIPHIIPNIQLPEAPKVYSLYQKANESLYQLWGNEENHSKEKWQEIFRLKFANRENPERFRQGFAQLLAVQHNSEADQVFEFKLRKCADDLVEDGLCEVLANYLKQKQWRKADEETAWIFYQVMVKGKYEDWYDLLDQFPCETLKKIDQLWLDNSNNTLGISIQSRIYQSLSGEKKWEQFCDRVWGSGKSYNEIIRDIGKKMIPGASSGTSAYLPVSIYTKYYVKGLGDCGWGVGVVFGEDMVVGVGDLGWGGDSLLSRRDL